MGFLSSDDVWVKGKLLKQLAILKRNDSPVAQMQRL